MNKNLHSLRAAALPALLTGTLGVSAFAGGASLSHTFLASRQVAKAATVAPKAEKDADNPCPSCEASSPQMRQLHAKTGGTITPVIVELKEAPGVVRKASVEAQGGAMSFQSLVDYSQHLAKRQDTFLKASAKRGLHVVMRTNDVRQPDNTVRHIEYRFSYLGDGFAGFVPTAELDKLRAQPEVKAVYLPKRRRFTLDQAIDYSLGTQTTLNDRRLAVYGAANSVLDTSNPNYFPDLRPKGSTGHPETPEATTDPHDGIEGQGINIAIIDSGTDFRHPMFGGTGQTTPLPQISGTAASTANNQKVIYYYALSSPGKISDDFGHGTLVSSCAAGYVVDGNTPSQLLYGETAYNPSTGAINTNGPFGVGPTPNGVTLHGAAPQAKIMEYKVCGPSDQCVGDISLAIEDAASPYTISGSTDVPTRTLSTMRKPVADVINLSLGGTTDDPTEYDSVEVNNASLAGVIVVAAAGNSGPDEGTLGAPGAATLAIAAAAGLDPGSSSGGLLLAAKVPDQVGDTGLATGGPTPKTGAASNALVPLSGGMGVSNYAVAGGGPLPGGSLSAHYVYVDENVGSTTLPVPPLPIDPPSPVPSNPVPPLPGTGAFIVGSKMTNRIALVNGGGYFVTIANQLATYNPAAILIITDTQAATAVAVVNNIPTFTISQADAGYLFSKIGGGSYSTANPPPNGTLSALPLRLTDGVPLASFNGGMADFSSRGPNNYTTAGYRVVKPDVTAPGVNILGAAVPDGIPEAALALSNPTGYVQASGTSFASPITAGTMALVRQHVRQDLGLDSTTLTDLHYRSKRFDAVQVSRALIMNTATNLRSGLGAPQPLDTLADGSSSVASIDDMGAGFINIAGAIAAKAMMTSPTDLQTNEFSPPASDPPAYNRGGTLTVQLPSYSFGLFPKSGTLVKIQKITLRDLKNGAGTYTLTSQNNRNVPAGAVKFLSLTNTPITSIALPAGGKATFYVQITINTATLSAATTELQWYVNAVHGSDQPLRMPFYMIVGDGIPTPASSPV